MGDGNLELIGYRDFTQNESGSQAFYLICSGGAVFCMSFGIYFFVQEESLKGIIFRLCVALCLFFCTFLLASAAFASPRPLATPWQFSMPLNAQSVLSFCQP
jgi:hypothetical protein